MHWKNIIEMLLIALAVFYIYRLFKGTQGGRILTGLMICLAGLVVVATFLELKAITLLLQAVSAILMVALIVIFQPELRQVLAEIGKSHVTSSERFLSYIIENVVQAMIQLKQKQLGALVAFDESGDNPDVIETGVKLESVVSSELLVTIFMNKSPLHDGGVLIQGGRIQAAGCIFPVSGRIDLNRQLGLRHRAALGMSEERNSIVVVLSEETGDVSLCSGATIERGLSPEQLRSRLTALLIPDGEPEAYVLGSVTQKFIRATRSFIPDMSKLGWVAILEFAGCMIVAVVIWIFLTRSDVATLQNILIPAVEVKP